ncbi:MAG: transposase [Ignavibacteria bacterium]|nr:transposase [Ignavibacteria bacterium]
MFRPNKKHSQSSFFGIQNTLPSRLKKKLLTSSQHYFYQTIFCNINEQDFSPLYSDKVSRPNAPINCLVAALILKHKNNWSYEELFEQIEFNILTKTALGLDTLDDIPFDDATIYNFQNRLLKYQIETNVNLMEQVFDKLTKSQLKELQLKTDIQRSDSLMATSNIRGYSRLQLLVEVLLRLWRLLDEADKSMFESNFSDYNCKSSGQYIYKLKAAELPHELDKIAQLYHFCKTYIMPKYKDSDFAGIFERIYTEHFTEVEEKIEVRPSRELNSSCLQSPDDIDATFREKRNEEYRGQSINITETASQDNPLNLIIDVAVTPNNIDDAQVLTKRIDKILEKTPDLQELHTDGAYGNPDNDLKFEEKGITHVQTAVRGRQCEVDIEINQITAEKYQIKCPFQSVESQPAGNRYKALMNKAICQGCRFADKCPAAERKSNRSYYFSYEDYLRNKRIRSIFHIPKERWKIRPNVEATVHEYSYRLTNGKLKYRGAFKAELFAYSVAIAINFGRIFRYNSLKPANFAVFIFNFVQIIKERLNYSEFIKNLFLIRNIAEFLNPVSKIHQLFAPYDNYRF